MKKIISILLLAVVTSFTFSSCEDMLTGDMDRHVDADEVASDSLYGYWGILKSLQGIAERYVILGECRGDLVDGTQYVQDSIHSILDFSQGANAKDGIDAYHKISDFYHVINSCNAFLANCDVTRINGLRQSIMQKEYAQVASIRAWAYLQLVLAYGRVPYFDTPMLSTAEMEDFRNAETWVDANTLVTSSVVKVLENVRLVEMFDYGTYTEMATASECMFPQNLVLGDIYLLAAGTDNTYFRQAAQCYYDFLNTNKGGPLLPNKVYGLVHKNQTTNQYSAESEVYMSMYSSMVKTSSTEEIVTVIPSAKNKLWGRVLRDINELFGHTASITVTTSSSDTTTTAVVALRRNFEHQLGASKLYTDLNKAQDFEAYIGSGNDAKCTVLSGAGDARGRIVTQDYTDYDNGGTEQVNFVMKQNPYGVFTTTYPVIYRKGSIWLRFAAALNGAGFPGYAFSILRYGLCGNPSWLPSSKYDYQVAVKTYSFGSYSYKTLAYEYWDDTETLGTDTTFYQGYMAFNYHLYQRGVAEGVTFSLPIPVDDTDAAKDQFIDAFDKAITDPDTYPTEKAFYDEVTAYSKTSTVASSLHQRGTDFLNYIDEGATNVVCDHIAMREMENAKSAPFLNFSTQYLKGSETNNTLNLYSGMTEYRLVYGAYSQYSTTGAVSMGIHMRGCGFLKMNELSKEEGEDGGTTYNYVNQINKMRKTYEGATTDLTLDEIYDTSNLDKVQCAIADLILDEMALETCFEGSRFYDLLCYSRFLNSLGVNGTDRVAKKIASRSGTLDASLYSRLQDQNNWYLPRP